MDKFDDLISSMSTFDVSWTVVIDGMLELPSMQLTYAIGLFVVVS